MQSHHYLWINVPENLNKFYIISTHIYALNVTFYDVFRKLKIHTAARNKIKPEVRAAPTSWDPTFLETYPAVKPATLPNITSLAPSVTISIFIL